MRGFKEEEYQKRLEKLKFLMEQKDIMALIITSPSNFRYFTGFDSNFWESPTRPWFLFIPLNDDPIAIIPSIGQSAMEKTWIKNIKTWESPNPKDEGISLLKDNIINLLPSYGNIGFELGQESHLRMSIDDYLRLKKILSNFNFVNASNIIWQLRMIKSKNEIDKIKKITSITSKVFDNLTEHINIGMTEIDICNIFKKQLIENGADNTAYLSCASSTGGYDQIICNPSNKKIEDGDILIIDTGTAFDGYFCDIDRNFGFGNISNKSKNAYNILWETTEEALKNIKPGSVCRDINDSMLKILKKSGLKSNSVGRMGHGLGLQITEPPSIYSKDETVLKENMILTIEPCFEYMKGKMIVHEENILITENGYELLSSRTPKNIPIII